MSNGFLESIQVGQPRTYSGTHADGRPAEWTTAFVKEPVTGAVMVYRTRIEGDAQADLEHHGGPDKAVLAYSADHYPVWRDELAEPAIPFGGFGENLTIRGLSEQDVCIGDIWRIGGVRLEVSQPRQPCWKLGRRWNRPWLPKRVMETARSGWYLRVLTTGQLEPGVPVELELRRHPEWTVARVSHVMYSKQPLPADVEALAGLKELADSWRGVFAARAAQLRLLSQRAERNPAAGD